MEGFLKLSMRKLAMLLKNYTRNCYSMHMVKVFKNLKLTFSMSVISGVCWSIRALFSS